MRVCSNPVMIGNLVIVLPRRRKDFSLSIYYCDVPRTIVVHTIGRKEKYGVEVEFIIFVINSTRHRRPSNTVKHGTFSCCVCGVAKSFQFPWQRTLPAY